VNGRYTILSFLFLHSFFLLFFLFISFLPYLPAFSLPFFHIFPQKASADSPPPRGGRIFKISTPAGNGMYRIYDDENCGKNIKTNAKLGLNSDAYMRKENVAGR
jgi:hypothetical protein